MNRLLAAFIFISSAGIALSAIEPERELYTATKDRGQDELANFSHLFLKDAEDTFASSDAAVVYIRYILESVNDKAHAIDIIDRMMRANSLGAGISSISVFDKDGKWQAGYAGGEAEAPVRSKYSILDYHNSSSNREFCIWSPQYMDQSQQWIIPISRRVDAQEGAFWGVVVSNVDAKRLSDLYKAAFSRSGISVNLFKRDGTLLTRYPFVPDALGATFHLSPKVEEEIGSQPSFLFDFQGLSTGETMMASIYRSSVIPVSVVVAQPVSNVTKAWQAAAVYRILFRVLASAAVAAIGFGILSQIRYRQRIANRRLQHETEFRILAEGSGDAVFRVQLGGKILYASPAATRITSIEVGDLQGRLFADLAGPNEAGRVADILSAVATGRETEGRASFSFQTAEGGLKHVTASVRLAETEQESNLIIVLRDDTDGFLFERKLASLAATDPLTGLANRRIFSERLHHEWRRAARDGQPISLLFIDGDRFKKFNDTYGHPAGDQCLRTIAEVLTRFARRPSDLAARYGGEEFVLLLPNTDGGSAHGIADCVRSAVEMLGIPHERNTGVGIVTVSVGVATLRPDSDGTQQPDALISRSDAALYAAKAAGRNCVRSAGDVFDPPDVTWV